MKPGAGFNHQVINELIKIVSGLKDCQRYIVLSFDEMKIKENLVYDKYSGQLVGHIDLGDSETNSAYFKDPDSLATLRHKRCNCSSTYDAILEGCCCFERYVQLACDCSSIRRNNIK